MTVLAHEIYQPAKDGPFLCGHCQWFSAPTTCHHPEIIKLRRGVVEFGGCCDYYQRGKASGQPLSKLGART